MSIEERLKEEFEEDINNLGYELVDIELKTDNSGRFLRFYIYKPIGITADDCEKVSKFIDPRLDELDLIKGAYYLEVSSPDLNRAFKTKRDFERTKGQLLEIKTKTGEVYLARFKEFLEDKLVFQNDTAIITFEKEEIKTVKIAIVF